MKSNVDRAAKHGMARRAAIRLTLAGALAVCLSACGGGGGGSDSSDDSRDLRAALDRLKAGMTYEEVVAAVGWEPNETRNVWSHDGLQLQVIFGVPYNGDVERIETARLSGRGDSIDRDYR